MYVCAIDYLKCILLCIDIYVHCRNSVDKDNPCIIEEDVFGSLLAPVSSKQELPPVSILAEAYCTTIACYDNSLYIAHKVMLFSNMMLLQLQSNSNVSFINGYSSPLDSVRYCINFTIGRDTANASISSFIVLSISCNEVSSGTYTINNQLVISYFGLDVALSKSHILLYGTNSTSGDVFYTTIPSNDHCFNKPSLKSYLLLSMNQPVIEIIAFKMLCSNNSEFEPGVNSLFFIGKDGKVSVLFSYGKCSGCKEFSLNMPVYSACSVKQYLLISSYKEIVVINLECKESDTESIDAVLVEAFCNPSVLKINSVMRMYVDTKQSVILMAKRNGHIYTLDESDLKSSLLSLSGSNLQEVVTQIGEVSDKVELVKSKLNITDMHLKQINSTINLFILANKNGSFINCQLFPEMYYQINGGIAIKLNLQFFGAKINTNGWFLSVHILSSKFNSHSSFYSLSGFIQAETFSRHLTLSTKDLPFQVACVIYCDLAYVGCFDTKKAVGISTVLKQESLKFNVLDFLTESDSNAVQHTLCNREGYLILTKQFWEQLENSHKTNLLLKKLLYEAVSDNAGNQLAPFVAHKANIANTVYIQRINKEECVIAKLLANSAAFVCELRAAIIENFKASVFRCL